MTKKHYPVDSTGHMLEYAHSLHTKHWLPMEPFIAELSFEHYEQGRSSLRLILIDPATNLQWSMMAKSIDLFVANSHNGRLLGRWNIVKRGASYGIVLEEVF